MAILTKRKWKTLIKEDLPQTVFLAITIISASSIILPMWNYTKFYTAFNNFNYTLSKATIYTSNINVPSNVTAQINITLLVTNPTDYSGLRIGTVGCDLYYYGNSHTVWVGTAMGPGHYNVTNWWILTSASTPKPLGPIGPNSNMTILIEISITPDYGKPDYQQNADFLNYLLTKPPPIEWSIDCHLPLSTFLGTSEVSNTFYPVFTPLNQTTT